MYQVSGYSKHKSYNSLHIYQFTYLLTPSSKVLFVKLPLLQLVKKYPAFHGAQYFSTAFTIPYHLCLSWDSSIQSILSQATSRRSILILSFHLWLDLPSGPFPEISPPKPCRRLSTPPYALHDRSISFFSILLTEQCWVRNTGNWAAHYVVVSTPCYLVLFRPKYFSQHPILKHPQLMYLS